MTPNHMTWGDCLGALPRPLSVFVARTLTELWLPVAGHISRLHRFANVAASLLWGGNPCGTLCGGNPSLRQLLTTLVGTTLPCNCRVDRAYRPVVPTIGWPLLFHSFRLT